MQQALQVTQRDPMMEIRATSRAIRFPALAAVFLGFLIVPLDARSAVVETVLVSPGTLPVGQAFDVDVRVTNNSEPIGAFVLLITYSKASILKVDYVIGHPDFSVTEVPLADVADESRLEVYALATSGGGGMPESLLFTVNFRVIAPDCAAAVRVGQYLGQDALTNFDTFLPIPTTFNSTATEHLFRYTATGDLTGDGQRNSADVQRLRDIVLGRVVPDAQSVYGDMNADCALDTADLLLVERPTSIAKAQERRELAQIVDDRHRAKLH